VPMVIHWDTTSTGYECFTLKVTVAGISTTWTYPDGGVFSFIGTKAWNLVTAGPGTYQVRIETWGWGNGHTHGDVTQAVFLTAPPPPDQDLTAGWDPETQTTSGGTIGWTASSEGSMLKSVSGDGSFGPSSGAASASGLCTFTGNGLHSFSITATDIYDRSITVSTEVNCIWVVAPPTPAPSMGPGGFYNPGGDAADVWWPTGVADRAAAVPARGADAAVSGVGESMWVVLGRSWLLWVALIALVILLYYASKSVAPVFTGRDSSGAKAVKASGPGSSVGRGSDGRRLRSRGGR
jgi:hypothetical protein